MPNWWKWNVCIVYRKISDNICKAELIDTKQIIMRKLKQDNGSLNYPQHYSISPKQIKRSQQGQSGETQASPTWQLFPKWIINNSKSFVPGPWWDGAREGAAPATCLGRARPAADACVSLSRPGSSGLRRRRGRLRAGGWPRPLCLVFTGLRHFRLC